MVNNIKTSFILVFYVLPPVAKSKVIAVEYDHDEIKQAIRSINAAGYKKKAF